MKTILTITLLFFFFNMTSIAQGKYSVESLEKLSQEELNIYLDEALKLQKTGKTLTKVGLIALGADGLLLTYMLVADKGGMGTAAFIGFTGIAALGTIAVGIPMNGTGKKRVERLNTIKSAGYNGIKIDIKPRAQYNFITQNYQPGVTLRISF